MKSPINPLSLGMAYFGFSVVLVGLGHGPLGWVSFAVSVALFIAVFWGRWQDFLNRNARIALSVPAVILGTFSFMIGLLSFLSGKGGWIVSVFLIFGLLWIVTFTGAMAGAERKKRSVIVVSLIVLITAGTRFFFRDYVAGVSLLGFGVFLLLAARGTIKLPEPQGP